jgi:hypothetical protein
MKKINNELTPPRRLVPDLTERADWAIRRALSADPNQRPATCREFIEDLTGHSTRKLVPPEGGQSAVQVQQDLWYLVYKDDEGVTHTVKGTTDGIRRSLKERLLGDAANVRACRSKQGPFEPLKQFTEFRDLVSNVAVTPPHGSQATAVVRPASQTPTHGPHIRIEQSRGEPMSWIMGGILLVLALATAIGTLYFFLWQ